MKDDDIHITGLLDLLNLRFGASQGSGEMAGGIDELAAIQKEFDIFRADRKLSHCFAALNLGGFHNARAKNRWFTLIDSLTGVPSDADGVTGHDRLMALIIDNLAQPSPLPMYFVSHDSRVRGANGVQIKRAPHGPFYMEHEHWVVSIPMRPKPKSRQPAKSAKT